MEMHVGTGCAVRLGTDGRAGRRNDRGSGNNPGRRRKLRSADDHRAEGHADRAARPAAARRERAATGRISCGTSSSSRPTPGSSASARRRGARRRPRRWSGRGRSSSAATRSPIAAFARELLALSPACYAGIELACLDACGKATGRRLCELLGGPVRDPVEFAAYLFYRYAADHPVVLADPHLVAGDRRGKGDRALDAWGEVRSARGDGRDGRRRSTSAGASASSSSRGACSPPTPSATTLAAMAARLGAGLHAADRPQRPLAGRDGDPDRQDARRAAPGILRGPRPRPGGDGRGPPRDRA